MADALKVDPSALQMHKNSNNPTMKFILIDTNTWINFIHERPREKEISQLEYWVAAGVVTLLVPQRLLVEWEKHKVLQLQKTEDLFIKPFADAPLITKLAAQSEYVRVQNRVNRISRLLDAIPAYDPTDTTKAEVTKMFEAKKAPFHKNQDSTGDALIYLSAIEYLQINHIPAFFFLTGNKIDFGDPENQKKLHPDLKYSGVETLYFLNATHAFYELGQGLPPLEIKTDPVQGDYVSQFDLRDNPHTASTITDSITQALGKYYDQLPFIPLDILARVYPFKIINTQFSYTHFSAFLLSTNNHALLEYFKNIEISPNSSISFKYASQLPNEEEEKTKVTALLRKLNDNLIYSIAEITASEEVFIRLNDTTACDCVKCSYERTNFLSSLTSLQQEPAGLPGKMKHAYTHFKFGNFEKALNLFFQVYDKMVAEQKTMLAFICLHNIKVVKYHINAYYSELPPELKKLTKKADALSLNATLTAAVYEPAFVFENMKWLAEKKHLINARIEIIETVEKIREHYQIQQRGGRSSNNQLSLVICKFAEYESYLHNNNILYDTLFDLQGIFEYVLEGLLITSTFNAKQYQQLRFFDGLWIRKIIMYARPDRLVELMDDYSVRELRYRNNEGENIEQFFLAFLQNHQALMRLVDDKIEGKAYYFSSKYEMVFCNMLVVLTYIRLDDAVLAPIVEKAIDGVLGLDVLLPPHFHFFTQLLYTRGHLLSEAILERFLQKIIHVSAFHKPDFFAAFNGLINKDFPAFRISDQQTYQTIVNNFSKICPQCNMVHQPEILANLYGLLSKELQQSLSAELTTALQEKFNPAIYYKFSVYNMIDYTIFFDQYVQFCHQPENAITVNMPSMGEIRSNSLSNLLNLAFKNNIDLNCETFQRFKGVTDYYDWLLDMNNFNYEKFKPDWILEYQTLHYLKKIFSCAPVVAYLKKYLANTPHPVLSKYYFEYTTV